MNETNNCEYRERFQYVKRFEHYVGIHTTNIVISARLQSLRKK